jgi:transglutaminase-like putative cysteine protease
VRALVAAACVTLFVGGFSTGFQQAMAALATLAGVLAAELLARSSLRLLAVVPAALLLTGLARWTASLMVHSPMLAQTLGPAALLGVSGLLRLAVPAGLLALALRTTAARRTPAAIIELAVMAGSVAALFSAHRDGVVLRPLWLSDWAFDVGVSPQSVLLATGALLSLALASLTLLERRRSVSLASLLALPVLAAMIWSLFTITDLPERTTDIDLGLTEHTDSDEWNLQDEGTPEQGGNSETDEPESAQGGQGDDGEPAESPAGGQSPDGSGPSQAGQGEGQPQPSGQGQGQSDQQDSSGSSSAQPPPPQPPDFSSSPPNRQNPSPMAVIVLGDDYEPPSQAWYFRQESWSEFNGQRLVPSRSNYDADGLDRFPIMTTAVREPPPTAARQMVRHTVAMLVDHTRPLALESPTTFIPAINPDPERFTRAYNVESWAPRGELTEWIGSALTNPDWSPPELQSYLVGPDDPRFAELAREIIAVLPPEQRSNPALQALAIKTWLDDNLIYSTRHQHAGTRSPAADFLFGDRTGYCVHFAHASVFLMRSLGIPSRIASGYMVPAENRRGSNILLTSSDAHAWPEVWVDGVGWMVVDIHPRQVLDDPLPPTDEELTFELGEMARQQPDAAKLPPTEQTPRINLWAVLWWQLRMLAVLAVVGLFGAKLYRRLAPRIWPADRQAHVAYRAALDMLSDAGLVRRSGETRMAFAERVASVAPSMTPLTRLHERERFADQRWLAPSEVQTWLGHLRRLRSELRSAAPWWRRWISVCHPFSIFFSR